MNKKDLEDISQLDEEGENPEAMDREIYSIPGTMDAQHGDAPIIDGDISEGMITKMRDDKL